MKKLKYVLLVSLLFTVGIFIFCNDLFLVQASDQSENVEANEIANEIIEKIQKTGLSIQIQEELKKNGYHPSDPITYQIYSPDKQYIGIRVRDLDQEGLEKNVQEIVDVVSKANNFNTFIVDIQKVK